MATRRKSLRRQNTFSAKVAAYRDMLHAQTYRTHWGLPNLHVLTVSTSYAHVDNIVRYITRSGTQYADRFGFACEPTFGANWRVPRSILTNLLGAPWITAAGTKDIARP